MIDLRSDTVTRPSREMFAAIAEAPLGDDIYDADPTTRRLEETIADRLGKEAGLLLTSGTQSNLTALLLHCRRGDEYIAGKSFHIFASEAGGGAVLGGISPFPIDVDEDGSLDADTVEASVKPDNIHYPRTRLVAQENTVSGRIVPQHKIDAVNAVAERHGLNTHLDGARLFNASAALGIDPANLTHGFDSVSLCLSKGLGAPAGSVLCGSREFVKRGRHVRKLLGGAMRQSGVLAACGLVALENNVARLTDDHANARKLADGLADIPALRTCVRSYNDAADTNMVFIESPRAIELEVFLSSHGIKISADVKQTRLVTHRDISAADIDTVIARTSEFFAGE